MKSLVVNDEPEILYICLEKEGSFFVAKFDSRFERLEPLLLKVDNYDLVGIMGFGSFAAFKKGAGYVYVSLESG